ncbi:sensor histidine kinase [Kineococcus indalonis]|uniref:sensor histidine kinase n=1 Tax=Kineococcus indalonis TaxID=2696566 RepID=UPI001412F203|nr:ATP-binding protein [Kineococcus indalonis]NAZ87045.1 PAS domain-containing protein [Kineococcus indalonis]
MSATTTTPTAAEAGRLAALDAYGLLGSPADPEVEAVARVAALVARVPSASVHLITAERQCQLAGVRFEGGDAAREDSLCGVQLHTGRFVQVPDARLDARYADKPSVTGERGAVRFHASAPLLTEAGQVLGTLCVFDTEPGALDAAQVAGLEDLARVLVALFERRRQSRLAAQRAAEAERHAAEAAEQRALAELVVAEAEARHELTEAVLESVDVGIVVAGPDGRLSEFNRTARQWHGLDADAALDPDEHAGAYDLRGPDGTTALRAREVPLQRTLREGRVRDAEMVIAPAGREPITVRCTGRTMTRADGTPLGAVVAMADITAIRARKRQLETALAELAERSEQLTLAVTQLEVTNTELARSNGELEQFAGIASHDLNSPLMVVDGYLEMLHELHGEQLDEQALAWITAARRGTGRMKELISALLGYARAGGSTCRRERVQLDDVVDQAVLDLRASIAAAGARVSAEPLPAVQGDAVLLRQLLQNLIDNAVKYRHPARPCRVSVGAERDEHGWVVAVRDNGTGIPLHQREAVFAVFAQVDPGAGTGHGIGLATCRRIVERHGGWIRVEDTPGGGTTVRFSLPQHPGPA